MLNVNYYYPPSLLSKKHFDINELRRKFSLTSRQKLDLESNLKQELSFYFHIPEGEMRPNPGNFYCQRCFDNVMLRGGQGINGVDYTHNTSRCQDSYQVIIILQFKNFYIIIYLISKDLNSRSINSTIERADIWTLLRSGFLGCIF
jgi:hypothetical protein